MKNSHRLKLSKSIDKYVKKSIKDIDKNSRDITSNYKYKANLGLAFANVYGEEAREYFHIICKPNVKYNKDNCDEEYTGYLKLKDDKTNLTDFFHLYGIDLERRADEMFKEFNL